MGTEFQCVTMMVMKMAGDVCATVRMYLMPLGRTLKRGKFYVMYILPQ